MPQLLSLFYLSCTCPFAHTQVLGKAFISHKQRELIKGLWSGYITEMGRDEDSKTAEQAAKSVAARMQQSLFAGGFEAFMRDEQGNLHQNCNAELLQLRGRLFAGLHGDGDELITVLHDLEATNAILQTLQTVSKVGG